LQDKSFEVNEIISAMHFAWLQSLSSDLTPVMTAKWLADQKVLTPWKVAKTREQGSMLKSQFGLAEEVGSVELPVRSTSLGDRSFCVEDHPCCSHLQRESGGRQV
jgi:hypothetical protein